MIAAVALTLAMIPAPARADHKVTVNYDTYDNNGVVCVQASPKIRQNDKNLKITKLNQSITWNLKRGKGDDAGGAWLIRRDPGGSVELCPDTMQFTNDVATCAIGTKLEYAYDLTWSKAGCPSVTADPAVIFDNGSGTPPKSFNIIGPIVGLILGLALGFVLFRRRGAS
jgi:hypothetical protein